MKLDFLFYNQENILIRANNLWLRWGYQLWLKWELVRKIVLKLHRIYLCISMSHCVQKEKSSRSYSYNLGTTDNDKYIHSTWISFHHVLLFWKISEIDCVEADRSPISSHSNSRNFWSSKAWNHFAIFSQICSSNYCSFSQVSIIREACKIYTKLEGHYNFRK